MADIRIRANELAGLTPESLLVFEAENGENYTFTVKQLVKYLVKDGSVVIEKPNAGVDSHGDLQNILGDGEYHLSQTQLGWIREQMYTSPTINPNNSFILGTNKVGDNISYNNTAPGITITNPNNTDGILNFNTFNGASTNTPSTNIPTQTGNFNYNTANLQFTNITKNSHGNLKLATYTTNEQGNPSGNNSVLISNVYTQFAYETYVFLSETDITDVSSAQSIISAIENNSSNAQMIYNGLRTNNYSVNNLSVSNPDTNDKYIYIIQPSHVGIANFSIPKINYGFGNTDFNQEIVFQYSNNDNGVNTTYFVYRADVNSITTVSPGSPITISLS